MFYWRGDGVRDFVVRPFLWRGVCKNVGVGVCKGMGYKEVVCSVLHWFKCKTGIRTADL